LPIVQTFLNSLSFPVDKKGEHRETLPTESGSMSARTLLCCFTVSIATICAGPALAQSTDPAAAKPAGESRKGEASKPATPPPEMRMAKYIGHHMQGAEIIGPELDGPVIHDPSMGGEIIDGGMFPDEFGPSCGDGCGLDCGDCGECVNCCDIDWGGWDLFGEVLFLRARNAEVAYGVPVVAPLANLPDVQRGTVGVVDQEHNAGFRAGLGFSFHDEACVRVTYTQFDSTEDDAIAVDPPIGIVALTVHPGTQSADTLFLTANATNHIAFEFLDVDYRRTWRNGASYALDWVAGARYGHLDQDFAAVYDNNLVVDRVRTNLQFDGGGLRVGMEGECWDKHGFSFYSKASASFLAGEFRGDYTHGNTPQPIILVTSWEAGRIVTVLDLDMGLAWTSPGGCWRFSAGYLFSGWFNTVNTDWFIDRVRNNNFNELSEGLGFDGLALRAELRF
jgi:hypothetical protein